MSNKNDYILKSKDNVGEDAISMEWSPEPPGSYQVLPLSCEHESLSKPTHQNETPFGSLNTSIAEEATMPLSETGMTQTRGPGPLGQFQKRFTKPLVPFLTMVYLHAESILQAARSVRVFHMQSLYIARQALHLVVLLNDLVDPEEGPDDTQQEERIDLEDDLIELLEAMEEWDAGGEEGGSVDDGQRLLKIQHQYTQIFKERFYFHDVRDYTTDVIYQKLLAYDERTIEKRQRCQIASNIIQVDYWIGQVEHYFEDQEEPEATPEIRMASIPALGRTDDVVPFSAYASAPPIDAVGYSPLETSMMSIDESNSRMNAYIDHKTVPHFRPSPYNPLRDMSETPLPIQNKSTDGLIVGAHDGVLPTAHGRTSHHTDSSSPGSYSAYHPLRNDLPVTSDGMVETSGPRIRQNVDYKSVPKLAPVQTVDEENGASRWRREKSINTNFFEGESRMKQEDDEADGKADDGGVGAIRNNHRLMPTGFEVPLTESSELIEQIRFRSDLLEGLGLLQDANLRNLYGYYSGGSNPRVGLSDVPDHPLPLMRNSHTPLRQAIQLARPFLDYDITLHPLTSHDDYFCSVSDPNWSSMAIPDTTSDSIGEIFVGSIVGPKSTPFDTPNGPSDATPDLMIQEKMAPPIAMKTLHSPICDKEAQSNGLTRDRRRDAANCSLGTVSNSLQRFTKALPYQRTLCKTDLSYSPGYLRVALSRLLKIVAKSLFVSQNILEPTIGSNPVEIILIEVRDRTGVWLGDKVGEGKSIYSLFLDRTSNMSLICGHATQTPDRALGHIRSMLDHRPFPCLGKAHGCNSKKCSGSGDKPFRFFTQALRDDHIRRQGLKHACITCGAMIRRGGMARHVRFIHPETDSKPLFGEEGSGEKIM